MGLTLFLFLITFLFWRERGFFFFLWSSQCFNNQYVSTFYIEAAKKSKSYTDEDRKRKIRIRSTVWLYCYRRDCLCCKEEVQTNMETEKSRGHDVKAQDFDRKIRNDERSPWTLNLTVSPQIFAIIIAWSWFVSSFKGQKENTGKTN